MFVGNKPAARAGERPKVYHDSETALAKFCGQKRRSFVSGHANDVSVIGSLLEFKGCDL